MKNTKEIEPILIAIYCINQTNDTDNDIKNLCEYAFIRCLNTNFNMLKLLTITKSKGEILPEIMKLLGEETAFKKYMESKNK